MKTKKATRAEVAAYLRVHPERLEEFGEMLAGERAEVVYRAQHARSLSDAELLVACRAPSCPYAVRGLECRNTGADGICRCPRTGG